MWVGQKSPKEPKFTLILTFPTHRHSLPRSESQSSTNVVRFIVGQTKMSQSLRPLRRLLSLTPKPFYLTRHHLSTEPRAQKLDRIATELLSLDRLERHDFTVLWRLKMGLDRFQNPAAGLGPISAGSGPAAAAAGADAKAGAAMEEKTVFDIKLEKYDAASKIKIIKEVRAFTDLGLKDAKDLVEKVPCVLKKGLSKDEADSIIEKLKGLGATVVLE